MSFTGSALQHFNHGVVLTSQPLQVDELFEVRLDSKVPKWYGSLDIGATTVSPENMAFPTTITSMAQGTTFALSSDKIVHNGKEMTTISKDLDSLSVCNTLKKYFWPRLLPREYYLTTLWSKCLLQVFSAGKNLWLAFLLKIGWFVYAIAWVRGQLRASAWETGADLEMRVGRFRLKSVHNLAMWTYATCQSFCSNELFLAEFWISAPQGSPEADFQCNFGHFSISLLTTYN